MDAIDLVDAVVAEERLIVEWLPACGAQVVAVLHCPGNKYAVTNAACRVRVGTRRCLECQRIDVGVGRPCEEGGAKRDCECLRGGGIYAVRPVCPLDRDRTF